MSKLALRRSLERVETRIPLWAAVALLPLAVLFGIGCAQGGDSGAAASTTASSSGAGGAGGQGGQGGEPVTASSSSGAGGEGGAGGQGGAGGEGGDAGGGGQGGAGGGVFIPPLGTAEHPSEVEQNNIKPSANPLDLATKGFTGSLYPLGDIDIYTLDITTAGSNLTVKMSDGMGGCPPNTNAFIRVFGPNNKLILGKKGGCPVLEPPQDPAMAGLAVGTYYVQVESASITEIPFYVLDIATAAPGCGDSIVQFADGEQCDDGNTVSGDGCSDICKIEVLCGDTKIHVLAGEQCDDGNTTAGDGCSDTCQIEGASYVTEVEPNDAPTPTSMNGYDGAVGSIFPKGDKDYFSFEVVVPNSSVVIKTTDGAGDCPAGFDSKIYLYNAALTLITTDDEGGVDSCSLISPVLTAAASNLAVGTYLVRVEEYFSNKTQPFYVLDYEVKPPGCGDLVVSPGEQCDDGNAVAGDGCSDTCQVEASCGDGVAHAVVGEQCDDTNTTDGDGCSASCQIEGKSYLQETEPNPSFTPNLVDGYDGAVGAISPKGDQDSFSFNVTVPGSTVVIRVSDGFGWCPPAFDSKIYLFNPAMTQIADDDDDGEVSCSLINPVNDPTAKNLAVGTYTIRVEEYNNDKAQTYYVLDVEVSPPGCGDDLVTAGEECDDGNTASGDGCSDTCQFELILTTEMEPNGDISIPNALDGFDGVIGSITPLADADYYSIEVTVPGSSIVATVSDGLGGCPPLFDPEIYLYTDTGIQLAYDDQDGAESCSSIMPILDPGAGNLPVGTYIIKVSEYGNDKFQAFYILEAKVVEPTCGDGVKQPSEECDDSNTTSGDSCDSACMAEPPWEIEPNNSMAEATVLWPGLPHWHAKIQPTGDHDWFVFNYATPGASLTITTSDIGDVTACTVDTVLHLVNSSGQEVTFDYDTGPSSCAMLSSATNPVVMSLPADTYYVWVQQHNDTATIAGYQITLTIQ
jgi:cysteine-rich repeat protein